MVFTRLHIWLILSIIYLSTCLVENISPFKQGERAALLIVTWTPVRWGRKYPWSAQVVPWMFTRNRNKISFSLQYRAQLLLLFTAKVSWKCSFGKDRVDFVGFVFFFLNHLKSRKQQKQVNMFIDWFVRQKKLYFAPLRTNVHTMGKHTMRTSRFNFLSEQTRQGKDYPLLGAASEKFAADWNCSTFPLQRVYLRMHIKIGYAKVKIAAHSIRQEIKLLFTSLYLNILVLFKLFHVGTSFQPVHTAADQSLQARSEMCWWLPAAEVKNAPTVQGLRAENN